MGDLVGSGVLQGDGGSEEDEDEEYYKDKGVG